MKQIKLILALLVIGFIATSCNDEDNTIPSEPVESKTITNLAALQDTDFTQNPPVTTGSFTKFSFKTGTAVTDDNWDIAFRGTTILVNGGTKIGSLSDEPERTGNAALVIQSGTFANVTIAPDDAEFSQDASGSYALPTGSDNGWYNYAGPPTHLISPLAGKVIIVRTIDGNYAKMEILNYYKDNDPTEADNARYYSFNYVYNPNVGDKSIQ
ncbi:HmuY family protein [uncultured Tenacibaculum sp.]|uniref:HmuY family protein n=1 Tax=uncultured Tenacibaculum sp. TaxID=174713 RepID=UPI0026155DD7|nr:HmuY family protein [uncultured Tenacibaculum sp.]